MKYKGKIKKQQINELAGLHRHIKDLKAEVTKRKKAEEALQVSETRYRRLFETAQDGILLLDADTGQILDVNPYLIKMLGYSHRYFLRKKLWEIGPFKDIAASRLLFSELQKKGYVRYEHLPVQTRDGRLVDVEFVSNVYLVDHEKIIQCNVRDITLRKRAETDLEKARNELELRVEQRTAELATIKKLLVREQELSRIDSLTEVPNRRAFYELAQIEIDRTIRFKRPLSLAYIDIDNFKQVNDTFGHSFGDSLLHSVAQTIQKTIRSIDIVPRLGGDEFAILMPETDEDSAKKAVERVYEHLMEMVQSKNLSVTFSTGVVTWYSPPSNLDELIKESDNLMYSAKRNGKNAVKYKTLKKSDTVV